uniref:Ig-like domain-containing protein n=1 Tax=Astyanax mexicanus TaxID=7994 RepID=A0A8B9HVG8_ASTMX
IYTILIIRTITIPCHYDKQYKLHKKYWCYDAGSAFNYCTIQASVEGQEGGGVRIQCLYSAGYQSEQKQWCRSKDQWGYKVGRTHTSGNSAVQISDDKKNRSFSVEMSGLKKSDAGWYWCRIKDLQASVYLSISDARGFPKWRFPE